MYEAGVQQEPAQASGFADVRLADAARGKVHVCFEGPHEAHLKQDVKERIW